MPAIRLTLIGKPGCHLCDDARVVISRTLAALESDDQPPKVVVEEKSILDDAALYERFVEEIPVVMINGKVHTYWRVDELRLARAVRSAA